MSAASPLSHEELLSLLEYDRGTGIFRWRFTKGSKRPAGSKAGCLEKTGYIRICINGRLYKAHRLAWLYVYREWPKTSQLDHVNGDCADNRIDNLREATPSQNQGNTRTIRNNKSGFKGVGINPKSGTYFARIKVNNRIIYLGGGMTLEEARAKYAAAAEQYFGKFARAA